MNCALSSVQFIYRWKTKLPKVERRQITLIFNNIIQKLYLKFQIHHRTANDFNLSFDQITTNTHFTWLNLLFISHTLHLSKWLAGVIAAWHLHCFMEQQANPIHLKRFTSSPLPNTICFFVSVAWVFTYICNLHGISKIKKRNRGKPGYLMGAHWLDLDGRRWQLETTFSPPKTRRKLLVKNLQSYAGCRVSAGATTTIFASMWIIIVYTGAHVCVCVCPWMHVCAAFLIP